ncbi:MAG: TolC family protein [Betaproteobacteria bacterium]|nr:TolC family protein [Betaproteobacteria bacterium]
MSIRRKLQLLKLRVSLSGLCLAWALVPSIASAQTTSALSLREAIEWAGRHERVIAARQSAEAAKAETAIADRAPAPLLTGSTASIDLDRGVGAGSWLTGKPIDKGLSVDWIWERGSKRALRTASAKHQAEAFEADYVDSIKQQQAIVIDAFYEVLSAKERASVLTVLAQSAEQLAKLASQRFQLGDLSAQDLARLDIEADRARGELAQSQWLMERARQFFRLALGPQFARSQWELADEWPLATPLEALDVESIAMNTPQLKAARARIQSAQAQIELAKSLSIQDPSFGLSLNHFPGTSNALLGLKVTVPLYASDYFKGETQRALALAQVTEAQYQELLRRTILELQNLYQSRANAYMRLVQFERAILPKSLKVALQAEQAFAQGGQTLTDLLEARRTLRTVQLEALQWRTDFAKALGKTDLGF